ncbi:MAG: DNA primase [Cytophagaceae bacterium]
MSIPQDIIDKIKSVVIIEDVIRGFNVNLKKAGKYLKANCPLPGHNENTASFTVTPTEGVYKCFGCGKSGDAIQFLVDHQGMDFYEAIKYLAEKYNIEITEDKKQTKEEKQKGLEREAVISVNKFAGKYFCNILHNTPAGKNEGYQYLKNRGFSLDIIHKFELGYSTPDWDGLVKAGLEKKFTIEALNQAGLIIVKEDKKKEFDRFRSRVMFPIHDPTGKVVGFGGRLIAEDPKQPKYMNSPETAAYSKGKILYGLYFSKASIRTHDECLLVEGYTDVISLFQHGIDNVVSSSGTSLTDDQIYLISKYTKNLTIFFDGDKAGIDAAVRAIRPCLEAGLNVRVVVLPTKQDPDSYIKKVGTPDFKKYVGDNRKDIVSFFAEIRYKEASKDPIKKAELAKEIASLITVIPDPITRDLLFKNCARILGVKEDMLLQESNKILIVERKEKEDKKEPAVKSDKPKKKKEIDTSKPIWGTFWVIVFEKGVPLCKLRYKKMLEFLQEHGYYRISMGDKKYQFVQIQDNVIDIVDELCMKDFVMQYIRNLEDEDFKENIEEAIIRGAKNYFSKSILESLDYKHVTIKRDTKEACFMYFKNGWVEITKEGSKLKEYKDLDGQIWKSQIIDTEIQYIPEGDSEAEFKRFLCLSLAGNILYKPVLDEAGEPKKDEAGVLLYEDVPEDVRTLSHKRILSACTAIGYMLHGYKDPSMTKAVVSVDAKLGKNGDMNGGSGKSLFAKALKYLIKEAFIEAQNFRFDNPFAFEMVNLDSKFVNFNDANARFEFQRLFSLITDDFTVNKKHIGMFTIPFDVSPKIYISTNHTIKGEGSSFQRRQFVIEFSDYFNDKHTPEKEFGHLLFIDWNREEWNRFYSFMFDCVSAFLSSGLVEIDNSNYRLRSLLNIISEDFYYYMENNVQLDHRYEKKVLFQQFKDSYAPDFDNLKLNTFSKYLQSWANYKGYLINPNSKNGRDSSNGVDYVTIVKRK